VETPDEAGVGDTPSMLLSVVRLPRPGHRHPRFSGRTPTKPRHLARGCDPPEHELSTVRLDDDVLPCRPVTLARPVGLPQEVRHEDGRRES